MTKAERIRKLAEKHPEWSTTQIAARCDCLPSYVRVVLRQRPGGSRASQSDRDYYQRNRETYLARAARNYEKNRSDPEFRERKNAYFRDWYARKKAEREASALA